MKAGRYYVGDLCYLFGSEDGCIFTDAEWDSLLEDTDSLMLDGNDKGGQFRWRGTPFFVSSTAVGDGTYNDTTGREYWVDAGIIGCWPLPEGDAPKGGHIVTFDTDFDCDTVDDDGVIRIGNLTIDTGLTDEDEDADEEDEDEDEDTDEEDGEE